MEITAYKIAILGPPNAGKTSLIRVLRGEFERLAEITPTKMIDRSMIGLMDKLFVVWDFGGQDSYRERYLKDSEALFDSIEYLLYVIDISDDEKSNLSKEYFADILTRIVDLKYSFKLAILFNKLDPEASNIAELNKKANNLQENFQAIAKQHGFEPKFYRTSIFDQMTVMNAFSEFLTDSAFRNYMKEILRNYVKDHGMLASLLFSESNFEISSYFSPFADPKQLRTSISNLIRSDQYLDNDSETFSENKEHTKFVCNSFRFGNQKFSLIHLYPSKIPLEENKLKDNLIEIKGKTIELLEKMKVSTKIT
jgi:GTPase SAR1 family protein